MAALDDLRTSAQRVQTALLDYQAAQQAARPAEQALAALTADILAATMGSHPLDPARLAVLHAATLRAEAECNRAQATIDTARSALLDAGRQLLRTARRVAAQQPGVSYLQLGQER